MDMKKMARRSMLEDLRKEMRKMEGEGLKKVSVMAKDSEGLKAGLEKAEDMVEGEEESSDEEGMDEMMAEEECSACKGAGCPICASKESEDELESMDKEELMAKLKELMSSKK